MRYCILWCRITLLILGQDRGWALVGSFAIVFLGLATGTSRYLYYIYRSRAYNRGAMIEAIYRKSLNLAGDTVGDATGGDTLNLMR